VGTELEQVIFQKVACPVYSTYGMTETVSHVALRRLNGRTRSDYFQILPGIEAKQDQRGCLMVRGGVTQHRWLTTNDIVEMQNALQFRWRGRTDNVINSGGVKIHTEELERKLESAVSMLGEDRRFFVAGLEDQQLGQRVCLFVEGKEAPPNQISKVQNWCKNELKVYERPKQIIFVPHFMQTPTGKTSRSRTIDSLKKD
jgi:o-succinylbenzoate---CoA ligase